MKIHLPSFLDRPHRTEPTVGLGSAVALSVGEGKAGWSAATLGMIRAGSPGVAANRQL
jgi:hypothetical protein